MFQCFKSKIPKVKKPTNMQFLFLYIGSKRLPNGQRLYKKFLKMLMRIIMNPSENQFLRKNACQYLGSFITVSDYVSEKYCLYVFKKMMKFQ